MFYTDRVGPRAGPVGREEWTVLDTGQAGEGYVRIALAIVVRLCIPATVCWEFWYVVRASDRVADIDTVLVGVEERGRTVNRVAVALGVLDPDIVSSARAYP